jgi:hypothetical protein
MNPGIFSASLFKRLLRWPLVCALLGVALMRASSADALYENDAVVDYNPGNPAPVIDATNFVNNNTFDVALGSIFETWDTLNYTNNGLMVADVGFLFDDHARAGGLHSASASFYNPGTIQPGAEMIVQATNIVIPGTIDISGSGLLQLIGNNVDLSRSLMTAERPTTAGLSGIDYGVGTDTNGDWDPSIFLQPTFAISSEFNSQLFPKPGFEQMGVIPSTPYYAVNTVGTNYVLTRAVFINSSASNNITENVYFGGNPNPSLGPGFVTVEWVGSYTNPATGQPATNYLYLNDFYLRGANTNNPIVNGVPSNFTFTELNAPAFNTVPATTQFPLLIPGTVSNNYSYVDLQLIATSVPTNSPSKNVTNYLAILAGRTEITASQELDLSVADISGQNYLSINSPNQYDGSVGAAIFSPYSDINIGETNGFMTVTNLLEPTVPSWNGTIQAWSSDWILMTTNFTISIDTNAVVTTNSFAVTNEYRVMLLNNSPDLSPTTPSQVQDLTLHATNSLVISDALNILRSLSIDAQSLTLTANGPNATSSDGELNLAPASFIWSNSLPNLLYLTNNGTITIPAFAVFAGHSNAVTVTPGLPATNATAKLSEVGSTQPAKNVTVTIGNKKYAFESTLTNALANQVKIASTFDGSMSNLIAAVNHGAGSGANYSSATLASTQVTAGLLSGHAFTVTAITAGPAGNSIAIATSATDLTWNGQAHLTGGTNAVAAITNVSSSPSPYVAFVNSGSISDQGSMIRANDFEDGGVFSSGVGSFVLQSLTTTLTNGFITASGDVSITTGTLLASNVVIQASRSLTLTATNSLTDGILAGAATVANGSVVGGNTWTVGASSVGIGLNMAVLPTNALRGDLLGTSITVFAPTNKIVANTWTAADRGISTSGYVNDAAVGQLTLNALGNNSLFTFKGAGATNAIYVDELVLTNFAAVFNSARSNVTALVINSNLVIYYAQALSNGVSVAEQINHWNTNHLRWISGYAGYYSSTNIVTGGVTNTVNSAVAQSPNIDSDGDGTPNASDPTPFFLSSEVNFTAIMTNVPPMKVLLQWQSFPHATNYVLYSTNLIPPNWQPLTNFVTPVAPPSPPVTVSILDSVNPASPRYYRVREDTPQQP